MADYNLKNIRALLIEGFSDSELRRFCYDIPEFRPVYHELAQYSGKADIVDKLIEYAERQGLMDSLLAWAKESNPTRYKTHQPYRAGSTQPSEAKNSQASPPDSSSSSVKIGNVGGAIRESTIAGRDVNIHYPQTTPPSQATSAREEDQPSIWRLPTVWWATIVVALIGLAGVLIPLFFNGGNPTPDASFDYLVRVQAKDTGENISNAQVTIEVGGQAPLDTITDSNGVARISIRGDYAGKPGVLLIEATGYERYRENMDLIKDALPDVVQLERAP
jgi:hypothetical protein